MSERINVTVRKKNVNKIKKIRADFEKQGRSFSNFAIEATIEAYEKKELK